MKLHLHYELDIQHILSYLILINFDVVTYCKREPKPLLVIHHSIQSSCIGLFERIAINRDNTLVHLTHFQISLHMILQAPFACNILCMWSRDLPFAPCISDKMTGSIRRVFTLRIFLHQHHKLLLHRDEPDAPRPTLADRSVVKVQVQFVERSESSRREANTVDCFDPAVAKK